MSISPTAPMQTGMVTLNVRQLDAVADYYKQLLDLETLGRDGNSLRLGVGNEALLELRGNPEFAQRSPRAAGLFHTAFLMDRPDLVAWVRKIARERIPVGGASDHLVSEAFYFNDPEGNGIEVYADRPRTDWQRDGEMIAMTTDPLDIDALLDLDPSRVWSGAPSNMIVGHVHLQLGDITKAEPFYSGVLGTNVTCGYPGAVFYGAGGYHHQLATNMWSSRGAGPLAPDTTGLVEFELILDSAEQRNGITERAGVTGHQLTDPWGIALDLVLRGE
ncbi:MAG: VOC family protein [Devosia sp.]|uniref:VOC family protein n=1 Tax=Devosia sp. TaxID=1871048 RepID=UPI0019F4CBC7|nr:VOC family protein [Devosia sp.]MBF0681046.1 VOC family protein [Devosia sp.]